jgi:hypothetical protein
MEHLSFVNEMLTAIGEPPHFARENIGKAGLQSPYFTSATLGLEAGPDDPQPISLPYAFERFERASIERFVCGESPPYANLPQGVDPSWCFTCAGEVAAVRDPAPLATARLGAADEAGRREIAAGNVQELYDAIKLAFQTLDGIFVPSPAEVEIPVEYNVFVFPVTDRATAVSAIDLILTQGEGLGDPWNLDSHFRRFMEIREELVRLQRRDAEFDPAYRLITNPERAEISNDLTREIFDIANEAYIVLLLMLASLYDRAVPASQDAYPHLASALSQMAFAPAMTMIVRALNEILVLLPADDEGNAVGSNYFIGDADLALLEDPRNEALGDISYLLGRWQDLTAHIERAAGMAEPPVGASLEYIRQSSYRIEANLRRIYQAGVYPNFVTQ